MTGFWGAITGRTKPKKADLDSLFLIPSAAVTLDTSAGLLPTGSGSVCFRAADGPAYQQTQDDVVALLEGDPDKPNVAVSRDDFGFTWLVVTRDPSDVEGLCTDLHAVNTALEEQGFGDGLLCSVVPFADRSGRRVGLVYLYKQGTFYGFAPTGPKTRDNLLEIQLRDELKAELPDGAGPPALARPLGRPRPLTPSRRKEAAEDHAESAQRGSEITPSRHMTTRRRYGGQSRWERPGRSSMRCRATWASRSVSGSTWIRLTTTPSTSDSSAHTRWGRSIRFIVEQ